MSELLAFDFNARDVRLVMIAGWVIPADVCGILWLKNSRKALADHVECEDRDGVTIRDAIGRNQGQTVVSESGLYALIFGGGLPTAKRLKRWVTNKVLTEQEAGK